MKIRIAFTLDVDAAAWAEEYGCDRRDVRSDVVSYVSQEAWTHLRDRGLIRD